MEQEKQEKHVNRYSLVAAFILVTFMLWACGGHSTVAADPALEAKVNDLTKALAATTHADAQKFAAIRIIGRLKSHLAGYTPTGRVTEDVAPDFGDCTDDMGDFKFRGGSDTSNSAVSQFEWYQNCDGVYTSWNDLTGGHDIPPFAAFSEAGCKGVVYLITDIPGDGFASNITSGGVVFNSPLGDGKVYFAAGQTPQSVTTQSEINTNGGLCIDTAVQHMTVSAVINSSASSTPDSLAPGSWVNVGP